jgi:hypothetical protein
MRASIGLVGCPHEGGKLGIEAYRILPERSMADVVVQRELGTCNFCSRNANKGHTQSIGMVWGTFGIWWVC